jgi:hypothetical protein
VQRRAARAAAAEAPVRAAVEGRIGWWSRKRSERAQSACKTTSARADRRCIGEPGEGNGSLRDASLVAVSAGCMCRRGKPEPHIHNMTRPYQDSCRFEVAMPAGRSPRPCRLGGETASGRSPQRRGKNLLGALARPRTSGKADAHARERRMRWTWVRHASLSRAAEREHGIRVPARTLRHRHSRGTGA